ncbi:hypothetical protein H6G76_19540 [Nostoc sp. FACHB-152]|uniref:hypothetical protein n=1 Tax=unclassified Nostoc TaxID=2593658 RepID=UPI00168A0FE6|nr:MULTISPECIES: hypothetical protein [unclassified Nostoc]MBD2449312.1 hypothetical protein [Nostoc sp. FACHB-152]MBD2470520.1 hypothetical protein [Nostoc sp. FACHB-145]
MEIITHCSRVLGLQMLAFAVLSNMAIAQKTPVAPQQTTTQKICSLDPVENLLPPTQTKTNNSLFSYLAQEGFSQSKDGSWVCYVNDPKKEGRYYTLFRVQELKGKLVGSSFLDNGSLIAGQDSRTVDFFMKLVEHHLNGDQENRQSIRRYLESFISLVKEGKIKASRRGFLFDQPNRALVLYHALNAGELKGTAITLNIELASNANSSSTKSAIPTSLKRR